MRPRQGRKLILLAVVSVVAGGCLGASSRRYSPPSPEELAQRRLLSHQVSEAISRGDWPRALSALHEQGRLNPDSPEVYERVGRVYTGMGDLTRADAAYRRAIELDPDYAEALCGLGEVAAYQGDYQGALEWTQSAAEIEPRRALTHEQEGKILEALGRPEEALAAYFRTLAVDASSGQAMARIGTIQLDREQYDQALARLTHSLDLEPGQPEVRFQRGRALLAVGHVREAVEELRTAASELPDRSDVHLALGLALERAQRPGEALEAVSRAIELAPENVQAQALSERLRR